MKNKRIPLKVRIALKILKNFCESNVICKNCIFYTTNTKVYNPSNCDLCYRNPYSNYRHYKSGRKLEGKE